VLAEIMEIKAALLGVLEMMIAMKEKILGIKVEMIRAIQKQNQ
jgi:hypothetical protein